MRWGIARASLLGLIFGVLGAIGLAVAEDSTGPQALTVGPLSIGEDASLVFTLLGRPQYVERCDIDYGELSLTICQSVRYLAGRRTIDIDFENDRIVGIEIAPLSSEDDAKKRTKTGVDVSTWMWLGEPIFRATRPPVPTAPEGWSIHITESNEGQVLFDVRPDPGATAPAYLVRQTYQKNNAWISFEPAPTPRPKDCIALGSCAAPDDPLLVGPIRIGMHVDELERTLGQGQSEGCKLVHGLTFEDGCQRLTYRSSDATAYFEVWKSRIVALEIDQTAAPSSSLSPGTVFDQWQWLGAPIFSSTAPRQPPLWRLRTNFYGPGTFVLVSPADLETFSYVMIKVYRASAQSKLYLVPST